MMVRNCKECWNIEEEEGKDIPWQKSGIKRVARIYPAIWLFVNRRGPGTRFELFAAPAETRGCFPANR
jgi:hypothetical protein